jgi:hypothetical protein
MAAARYCTPVVSHWIAMAILMCDDTLSVWFKDGVCCNYPRTTAHHYYAMIASDPGVWLHHNLYKILPYRRIPLPCPAAGCGQSTNCCPGQVPNSLHVTVTDGGGCGCLAGVFRLDWNAADQAWEYSGTGCGGLNYFIRLTCTQLAAWDLQFSVGGGSFGSIFNENPQQNADAGGSCHPFDQHFGGSFPFLFSSACHGTVTAEVTA